MKFTKMVQEENIIIDFINQYRNFKQFCPDMECSEYFSRHLKYIFSIVSAKGVTNILISIRQTNPFVCPYCHKESHVVHKAETDENFRNVLNDVTLSVCADLSRYGFLDKGYMTDFYQSAQINHHCFVFTKLRS